MTLVPEIRDQIHATAQRRVRSAGPARRSARPWRRMVGSLMIAASVLVVAGVLAVILLDVHHLTNGTGQTADQPASAPPPAWGKLNANASASRRAAGRRLPAPAPPRRLPVKSRRPGTGPHVRARCAAPASARQPTGLGTRSAPTPRRTDQRVRARYLSPLRPPRQRNGITYYFIPAANVNQVRAIPDRCYREQLDAFRQLAARQPPGQRPALTRYETTSLHQARTIAEHPAGVCLARVSAGGFGTGPCVNAVSLRQFNDRLGVGSDGNDHVTETALIVPDRVATVTAHYSPQTYPGRVPRPLTVTEPAVQNLVIFSLHGAWDPPSSLVYRSANGSVLWSITRP